MSNSFREIMVIFDRSKGSQAFLEEAFRSVCSYVFIDVSSCLDSIVLRNSITIMVVHGMLSVNNMTHMRIGDHVPITL